MKLRKQTIDDVVLRDKRVIIRADFNVPLDDSHQITDDTRIRSTLPTINRAVDDGAKVILCSHLGRPKGKFDPKYSLAPVAKRLGRLMGKDILFAPDCIGPAVEALVAKMKPGARPPLDTQYFKRMAAIEFAVKFADEIGRAHV